MRKTRILFLTLFLIFSLWTISDALPDRTKFLSSDFTAAINKTSVEGTDFTSKKVMMAYCQSASLTFYVKGNHASCSKDVIFKFATFDSTRNTWDTVDLFASTSGVSVTANGTTVVQKTIVIAADLEKIKLLSVQNQETVSGYTVDVNVSIFLK